MTQYGFLIDLSRCTGCNACVIACKQWHGIEPGPMKWMRVYQWEKGAFPDIDLRILPIMCFHCENPACAKACPNQAISKEEKYGAVLVDPSKCTGERKCWEACPYGSPQFKSDDLTEKMSKCTMCTDRLDQGLSPICVLSCSLRALEFGPMDNLREKYEDKSIIGKRKDYPPCRLACPAGINPQEYINLVADGKWREALDLVRETTPFAGILGRICARLCEDHCLRGNFDDAVAICSIKRPIADKMNKQGSEEITPICPDKNKKIAVVGSGPAGLSCAYDLIRQGYHVAVMEALDEPGGLMRYGIPEYRLPGSVLNAGISYIKKLGVDIKTGTFIKNVDDLFEQGFNAVYIAIGAWNSKKLGVPGEENSGVLYGLDFLRKAKAGGERQTTGKRVVVVGGGNVAIDAARTSLRLGAKDVSLVCLENMDNSSRDRMPAQDIEIMDAQREGVKIYPCLGIRKIITESGKVTGLEGMECISVTDEKGIFNPRFNECSPPVTFKADLVIISAGQTGDFSMLPKRIRIEKGRLLFNPLTFQTSDRRVFVSGDFVTGPSDVVSAIALGKEAAISIDRYLSGKDIETGRRETISKKYRKRAWKVKPLTSPNMLHDPGDFSEVDTGLDEDSAIEHAGYCLQCGTIVPSAVIKRPDPKKQVIPWNPLEALRLWQKRRSHNGEILPDIFDDPSDVTREPGMERIGRNRLVLKPKNADEILFFTTDDE